MTEPIPLTDALAEWLAGRAERLSRCGVTNPDQPDLICLDRADHKGAHAFVMVGQW